MKPQLEFLEDDAINVPDLETLQGGDVEDDLEEVDIQADCGAEVEVDEIDD